MKVVTNMNMQEIKQARELRASRIAKAAKLRAELPRRYVAKHYEPRPVEQIGEKGYVVAVYKSVAQAVIANSSDCDHFFEKLDHHLTYGGECVLGSRWQYGCRSKDADNHPGPRTRKVVNPVAPEEKKERKRTLFNEVLYVLVFYFYLFLSDEGDPDGCAEDLVPLPRD